MKHSRLILVASLLTLAVGGVALADGSPSPVPSVPTNSVPTWVFYWVLGLASVVISGLLLCIKALWEKNSSLTDKKSGLSEDERNKLNQLFEWHNKVDDDQVPLWYTPRAWVNLIQGLQQDHAAVRGLLTRIVEQNDNVNAELRQQVREGQERHDQLYAKMLRLAVRVQQAVEALAGLEAPSIEDALDDPQEDA